MKQDQTFGLTPSQIYGQAAGKALDAYCRMHNVVPMRLGICKAGEYWIPPGFHHNEDTMRESYPLSSSKDQELRAVNVRIIVIKKKGVQ